MGKVIEDTKLSVMHRAQQLLGVTVTYGDAVDTLGYASARIILNVDQVLGNATAAVAVYENNSNDPTTSIALTGAAFASLSSSQQRSVWSGNILTKNHSRYLWLRVAPSVLSGTATIGIGAVALLGNAQSLPCGDTATFDVE